MKQFSDETRRKMSEAAKKRCTVEWRQRSSEIHSAKIDEERLRQLYESGMTQEEVAVEMGITRKVVCNHLKKQGIKCRKAAKRNQFGESNHMWKGDSASYKAFHVRLKHRKGRAADYGCSVCGSKDTNTKYEWANMTGNYMDMNDYQPMCASCHRKYDKKRRDENDGRKTSAINVTLRWQRGVLPCRCDARD